MAATRSAHASPLPDDTKAFLRSLPRVDDLCAALQSVYPDVPRRIVIGEIRQALADIRSEIQSTGSPGAPAEDRVTQSLHALLHASLRTVVNATGVILHTNLGRAPLGGFTEASTYCNLEYDLKTGKRGRRDSHLNTLLQHLLRQPAVIVNNNAAAVYLALHVLAAGYEVIVSRGELIEIGDGFRIPDIMRSSGAVLREVGATNRTHIRDYAETINDRTRMLLRVHRSNFNMRGFTARPTLQEIASLGKAHNLITYEDLGSGCLVDLKPYGIQEPLVQESLEQGIDLISCSGDKLLGGPQAGILAGQPALIKRLRSSPMFRTFRADKLVYGVIEATLRSVILERYDEVPVLRMIRMTTEELRGRTQALAAQLPPGSATLVKGLSPIGGGSTPDQKIRSTLLSIDHCREHEVANKLREANPPVIVRVKKGRVLLDLRTVLPGQDAYLGAVLKDVLSG